MEIIKLTKENINEVAEKAASEILKGNLIIYPTDTVYGLGADADNKEAMEKLYEAKKRPKEKPISLMYADIDMMEENVITEDEELELIKKYIGPYTFALGKRGIRIAPTDFTKRLIEKCGVPITATSANLAGHKHPETISEAVKDVGKCCSLAIDSGKANTEPSTVIRVDNGEIKVLRKGSGSI